MYACKHSHTERVLIRLGTDTQNLMLVGPVLVAAIGAAIKCRASLRALDRFGYLHVSV